MPSKPGHPCAHQGCPEVIRDGQFCHIHEQLANKLYDQTRESAARRGYGKRWQAVRRMYLRRHPLCADPYGIHGEVHELIPANEVDHIVPKSAGGSDRDENLQGLCKSCHSRKTMMESKGRIDG